MLSVGIGTAHVSCQDKLCHLASVLALLAVPWNYPSCWYEALSPSQPLLIGQLSVGAKLVQRVSTAGPPTGELVIHALEIPGLLSPRKGVPARRGCYRSSL